MFTCPDTSMTVQHWLDEDDDAPENEYEAITLSGLQQIALSQPKDRQAPESG
jgi:hypothetical protein